MVGSNFFKLTGLLLAGRVSARLDVVFVLDTTATFTIDFPLFQSSVLGIMDDIVSTVDSDTQFGVAQFEDYPLLPYGVDPTTAADLGIDPDEPYERVAPLTSSRSGVATLVAAMTLGKGNDSPASALTAVFQLLTGDGQDFGQNQSIPKDQQMNFRSSAEKIIMLWTDGDFQEPPTTGTGGYPGPSFNTVIAELTKSTFSPPIRFVGLARNSGFAASADLKRLASATNAKAAETFDCYSGEAIAKGADLVCEGVGGSEATIRAAFVNMAKAAYEGGTTTAPPVTAGPAVAGLLLLLVPLLILIVAAFAAGA